MTRVRGSPVRIWYTATWLTVPAAVRYATRRFAHLFEWPTWPTLLPPTYVAAGQFEMAKQKISLFFSINHRPRTRRVESRPRKQAVGTISHATVSIGRRGTFCGYVSPPVGEGQLGGDVLYLPLSVCWLTSGRPTRSTESRSSSVASFFERIRAPPLYATNYFVRDFRSRLDGSQGFSLIL